MGLIGCGVVSSLDCGRRRSRVSWVLIYRLPHAYSQPKDHMAMASVRMHGRRKTETPRQHRAVQRPTQQRVRERDVTSPVVGVDASVNRYDGQREKVKWGV